MQHGFKTKSKVIQQFEKQKIINEEDLLLKSEARNRCLFNKHHHGGNAGVITKGRFGDAIQNLTDNHKNDGIWLKKANPSVFKQIEHLEAKDHK